MSVRFAAWQRRDTIRPMRWLADAVYLLAGLAYAPVALYQALVHGRNRTGWGERFGGVPDLPPGRCRIWVHGVSLGEVNATPRLIAALRERLPEAEIVFSSTTDTGHARAVQLYGRERVFRFPLDFSPVVARALRRIKPSLIVLMELEVWYNLTRMARARGVPVAVVNGRLTEHSARRLRWLGAAGRAMFGDLAWVGAQDATIAARFRALGVPAERVQVTGSLKWDTAEVTDRVAGTEALAAALGLDRRRPVWVCGSTGAVEEEQAVLAAHRRVLETWHAGEPPLLVVVPRKPERFDETARLIEQAGFTCVRRTQRRDGDNGGPLPRDAVILGDTMGELRKFYSLADAAFIGRSLVAMGGSDPMEAAALGRPILAGPHMENFAEPVEALNAAGAVCRVRVTEELAAAVREWLEDRTRAHAIGAKGQGVVRSMQGATQKTVERLVEVANYRLPSAAETRPSGSVQRPAETRR